MKDKLFLSPKIQIQTHNDQRGVFCIEDIGRGELIEEAHLILLNENRWEYCDSNVLRHAFPWAELRKDWKDFCDEHGWILPLHASRPVLVLGYGMVYGRYTEYNVNFRIEKKLFACNFTARCDIKEGEELLLIKSSPDKDDE